MMLHLQILTRPVDGYSESNSVLEQRRVPLNSSFGLKKSRTSTKKSSGNNRKNRSDKHSSGKVLHFHLWHRKKKQDSNCDSCSDTDHTDSEHHDSVVRLFEGVDLHHDDEEVGFNGHDNCQKR